MPGDRGIQVRAQERARTLPPLAPDVELEVERALTTLGTDVTVVVTGSIIEGFGNEHSDVDLYAVLDEGRPRQAVAIGIRASRYVDCEYFSAGPLGKLSQRMATADWAEICGLRKAEVNRYYRFSAGLPVQVTERGAELLSTFDQKRACEVLHRWELLRTLEFLGYGAALLTAGEDRPASLVLREAAMHLGSTELALVGEGYPAVKWLGEKAARQYGRGSRRFHELVDDTVRPPGSVADLLRRLRARLPQPTGLVELFERMECCLAPDVRVLRDAGRSLLVHRSCGVAETDGPLGVVLERLAEGMAWGQATEAAAAETGTTTLELRAAAWRASQALRASGHLVERTEP